MQTRGLTKKLHTVVVRTDYLLTIGPGTSAEAIKEWMSKIPDGSGVLEWESDGDDVTFTFKHEIPTPTEPPAP